MVAINYQKHLTMKKINYVLSLTLALGLFSCENDHMETDESSILSYEEYSSKSECHFEYEGPEGPQFWETLCNGNWMDCGGVVQSPINIVKQEAIKDDSLDPISTNFNPSVTRILNNGHTIQFNYDSGSTITLNGVTYNLLQFHFHTKSEHTINNKHYPMEMHLVHQDPETGNLAVLGVFFKKGEWNPVLGNFMGMLPENENDEYNSSFTYNVGNFFSPDVYGKNRIIGDEERQFNALKFDNDEDFIIDDDDISLKNYNSNNALDRYYTYSGSLTTPPCSETVTWYVLKKPLKASRNQLKKFKEIMYANYRPVQDLNGRPVRFSKNN